VALALDEDQAARRIAGQVFACAAAERRDERAEEGQGAAR